ncbi:MCE family protein [Nocardioides sp.]|uniref:MCE family protein n=1 Tax=Nocardioides sp. TaxID=35761 RepID=UPI0027278E79|nr:MlaD family protein [Nocardioides sp.]MDO9456329.1 MlaD family protein [Nocardioides sp.]
MKLLDKKTSTDATKLVIFMVVTIMATGLLVIVIGNIGFKGSQDYKAVFLDATGVVKGDDVRIAGVKVGTVKDIEVVDGDDADGPDKMAEVSFTVENGTELTQATYAAIRYRNLVGQRYLSLSQGEGEPGLLEPGETIPETRTDEALDLTRLFNGFKPLFEALSPDDINKLSFEVIQVFQGEGGTLEGLLQSTASVTDTLADRDAVIGQLLENLDFVLDHIADRDDQLSALIVNFRTLVAGLKDDRRAILDSFDQITQLSVETADLVAGVRPPFVEDIKQLRRLTANIDRNKRELDRALQVLPIKLDKIGRTAAYGSFFNFYLCNFKGVVKIPGLPQQSIEATDIGGARCDLG